MKLFHNERQAVALSFFISERLMNALLRVEMSIELV
jgi:hypothetical protein